jgi:hypothetical protein
MGRNIQRRWPGQARRERIIQRVQRGQRRGAGGRVDLHGRGQERAATDHGVAR